jgi:hypothetical protein
MDIARIADSAIIRAMRQLACSVALCATVVGATYSAPSDTLSILLERAGGRVEQYFARAQSLVCREVVHVQPLNPGWSHDGPGRTVESELQLSWASMDDGAPSTDVHAIRKVLRVNGGKPRAKDPRSCTTPEQEAREAQLLAMLLPSRRAQYIFTLAGEGRENGRSATIVDYLLLSEPTVETSMVDGMDDCVNFEVDGGRRGRIWFDRETDDVLRLDEGLVGMVEIPLPRTLLRRSFGPAYWTLERWDRSIRFKPVSFTNPDETLLLQASMSSLQVTRGAGTPRVRTMTEYRNYQRFLTRGRIVGE